MQVAHGCVKMLGKPPSAWAQVRDNVVHGCENWL